MYDTGRGAKPWAIGTAIMYDTGRGAKPWATGTAIVHDTDTKRSPGLPVRPSCTTRTRGRTPVKKNEKNFNSETTKKYIFADWLN